MLLWSPANIEQVVDERQRSGSPTWISDVAKATGM